MRNFINSIKETFGSIIDNLLNTLDAAVVDSNFKYFNLTLLLVTFPLAMFDEYEVAFYFLLLSYVFLLYKDQRNLG